MSSFEQGIVSQVAQTHGKDAVQLGTSDIDSDVSGYISTQCATMDLAIGRPGIPIGRLTVITGAEASAKSTLLYHILIETQQRGGTAILIDAENAYSKDRAVRMGMNHENLIYVTGDQPLEAIFAEIEQFIEEIRKADSERLVTIGLDSLSACATENQIKGTYQPGEVAKMTSAFFQKNISVVASHRIALVFVNQFRASIQFIRSYGPSKTMIAEGSLRYYGSLRIEMRKAGVLQSEKKDEPWGIMVEAECAKNKIAPPFRKAQFIVDFNYGIDRVQAQLEAAKQIGLVEGGTGGWYSAPGVEKKFQGSKFGEILAEHPEFVTAISDAPLLWTKALENGKEPADAV